MIDIDNTYFRKKDGSLSSIRTTVGNGNSKISISHYAGSNRGGVTFRSGNMTTRFNNQGQAISTGFKTNRTMTYMGSNQKLTNRIAPF